MNLTKIEKPFGLLSKKKQAALKAYYEAGGDVEVFDEYAGWSDITVGERAWIKSFAYRAKDTKRDELTKPQIPWDILADEWICAARDEGGLICVYAEAPFPQSDYWGGGAKSQYLSFLKIDPGTCDWKDSLVYRPGHEPEGKARTAQELANKIQEVAGLLPGDFTVWGLAQDLTILCYNVVTEAEALEALRILKDDGKAKECPTGTWRLL